MGSECSKYCDGKDNSPYREVGDFIWPDTHFLVECSKTNDTGACIRACKSCGEVMFEGDPLPASCSGTDVHFWCLGMNPRYKTLLVILGVSVVVVILFCIMIQQMCEKAFYQQRQVNRPRGAPPQQQHIPGRAPPPRQSNPGEVSPRTQGNPGGALSQRQPISEAQQSPLRLSRVKRRNQSTQTPGCCFLVRKNRGGGVLLREFQVGRIPSPYYWYLGAQPPLYQGYLGIHSQFVTEPGQGVSSSHQQLLQLISGFYPEFKG